MQILPRRWFFLGTACLVIALLSGCAYTKAYVSISYVPQTNVTRIHGADVVKVESK